MQLFRQPFCYTYYAVVPGSQEMIHQLKRLHPATEEDLFNSLDNIQARKSYAIISPTILRRKRNE